MSKLDAALRNITSAPGGTMKDRLLNELNYARRVSDALNGQYADLVMAAALAVQRAIDEEGTLTNARVLAIEESLMPMQAACKKYRLLLCGHAHIDMNWMWRYDETVQITLDTFKTVLALMDEYPTFTFSQSQASVYRIVEEFNPEMIVEIAKRVREGRWEIAATTWVEADRNMPSAESVARHHLYTCRYLPKLLDMPGSVPPIDYEPDTFGHNQNTPELLSQANIKYYYQCRGYDGHIAYRWRAPSGAEIIAYREPFWYLGPIRADMPDFVPGFCESLGITDAMRVYGVGDHGGGPTRRDIELALDMMTWPIYPRVEFARYMDFYPVLEAIKDRLPVVDRELNSVFEGCYTTQTRIKKGNRYGERLLSEGEGVNALANRLLGVNYPRCQFEKGWRGVLFNQFHDILTGSGVIDTREAASGLYQEAYAIANSAKWRSYHAIADAIDTAPLGIACTLGQRAEGAGVGFRVEQTLDLAPVGRGEGEKRIYHLFNSLLFDRSEVVELTLWDYKDIPIIVKDDKGNTVRHQKIGAGHNGYWGHDYLNILIETTVPAMGHATYTVEPDVDRAEPPSEHWGDPRVLKDDDWALENEFLRAEFGNILKAGDVALCDKRDGKKYRIDGFSFVHEDPSRRMTAWNTGLHISESGLDRDVYIKRTVKGELYNELKMVVKFGVSSKLTYTVGLYAGSDQLVFDANCEFMERGGNEIIPQIRFSATDLNAAFDRYTYDIPGGQITRDGRELDQPGLRFIATDALALLTDCKYGYQGKDGKIGVTLIRGTTDPDPHPELGNHHIRLAVALRGNACGVTLARRAQKFLSPVTTLSGKSHKGTLPMNDSLALLKSGSVEINVIKLAEDSDALVVRGVELVGDGKGTELEFFREVESVSFADTHEKPIDGAIKANGRFVSFDARKFGMFTVLVKFK